MATKQHFLKQKARMLRNQHSCFLESTSIFLIIFFSLSLLHLIAVIHRILIALFLLHSFIPLNKMTFNRTLHDNHSCFNILYNNESRQTPSFINMFSRNIPSFDIPIFSNTLDDPIFRGSQVA